MNVLHSHLVVGVNAIIFFYLAAPTAGGNSRARDDRTCTTAAIQATAVILPHLQPTELPGNSYFTFFKFTVNDHITQR